jgi:hypothetical protein
MTSAGARPTAAMMPTGPKLHRRLQRQTRPSARRNPDPTTKRSASTSRSIRTSSDSWLSSSADLIHGTTRTVDCASPRPGSYWKTSARDGERGHGSVPADGDEPSSWVHVGRTGAWHELPVLRLPRRPSSLAGVERLLGEGDVIDVCESLCVETGIGPSEQVTVEEYVVAARCSLDGEVVVVETPVREADLHTRQECAPGQINYAIANSDASSTTCDEPARGSPRDFREVLTRSHGGS